MDIETRATSTGRGTVSYGEHGSGVPVVFLHSLLTDRTAFAPVLDGLAGRAVLFDLPGFGETTPERTLEGFADSMAAAIGIVCDGETPVTVVGEVLPADDGRRLVLPDGEEIPLEAAGWQHFRRENSPVD